MMSKNQIISLKEIEIIYKEYCKRDNIKFSPNNFIKFLSFLQIDFYDAKILDKPSTSVRGESWTSENPNKLRTSVRSETQGFSDWVKNNLRYFYSEQNIEDLKSLVLYKQHES